MICEQQALRGGLLSTVFFALLLLLCTVVIVTSKINHLLQVAVLAPLALLLVLEARCVHFVIAHFNYFVLWSSASLAPTQHIYMYT